MRPARRVRLSLVERLGAARGGSTTPSRSVACSRPWCSMSSRCPAARNADRRWRSGPCACGTSRHSSIRRRRSTRAPAPVPATRAARPSGSAATPIRLGGPSQPAVVRRGRERDPAVDPVLRGLPRRHRDGVPVDAVDWGEPIRVRGGGGASASRAGVPVLPETLTCPGPASHSAVAVRVAHGAGRRRSSLSRCHRSSRRRAASSPRRGPLSPAGDAAPGGRHRPTSRRHAIPGPGPEPGTSWTASG